MTTYQPTPSQPECPAWCVRRHADENSPEDIANLVHESTRYPVAAVVLDRTREPSGRHVRHARATEIDIIHYQYTDDAEEWVYVGDGRRGVDLSPDSALRLARAINSVLDHNR